MDTTTRKVMEMYNQFPYPSPEVGREKLKEQVHLLKAFSLENKVDLRDKRILDAGTGTGHRLAQVAKAYPTTQFTAIDLCETSLELAKKTASQEGLSNVTHQVANLMLKLDSLGTYDFVLCIGVLHHLQDPKVGLSNLVQLLRPQGAIFLWLYGEIGGRERHTRHLIIKTLLKGNQEDYKTGIQLVKDLKFDEFEFGWDLNNITERERDALIVDAFLNINEKLYDVDSIHDLMKSSGLAGYAINGITNGNTAFLFDTTPEVDHALNFKITDIGQHLKTPLLRERFEALPILDRYRLADLFCSPSGYTVIGFTQPFIEALPKSGRLRKNLITLTP
jgi:SAM-dependent methyltransferase